MISVEHLAEIQERLHKGEDIDDVFNDVYELGRADAIDECIKTIINTPTKVGTHLKEPQRVDACLTMLADRQFEILGYLEQLKEKKDED